MNEQELQVKLLPEDIASFSFIRTVWKGLVPPRVELFIWFALTERVNTKERLSRLGVVNQEEVWCAWLSFVGSRTGNESSQLMSQLELDSLTAR
ncbi:hypothetical protein AHAS_Ahas13G0271900 [Arachis hypogaea]